MKIYVAGKWKERQQVKNIMDRLEARGHTITCDWTKHIAPERIEKGEGCFTRDVYNSGHKTYGWEDLEGVENCDILVAYMPDPTVFYKGAWIEIGISIAHRKRVIIIGKDIDRVPSIF